MPVSRKFKRFRGGKKSRKNLKKITRKVGGKFVRRLRKRTRKPKSQRRNTRALVGGNPGDSVVVTLEKLTEAEANRKAGSRANEIFLSWECATQARDEVSVLHPKLVSEKPWVVLYKALKALAWDDDGSPDGSPKYTSEPLSHLVDNQEWNNNLGVQFLISYLTKLNSSLTKLNSSRELKDIIKKFIDVLILSFLRNPNSGDHKRMFQFALDASSLSKPTGVFPRNARNWHATVVYVLKELHAFESHQTLVFQRLLTYILKGGRVMCRVTRTPAAEDIWGFLTICQDFWIPQIKKLSDTRPKKILVFDLDETLIWDFGMKIWVERPDMQNIIKGISHPKIQTVIFSNKPFAFATSNRFSGLFPLTKDLIDKSIYLDNSTSTDSDIKRYISDNYEFIDTNWRAPERTTSAAAAAQSGGGSEENAMEAKATAEALMEKIKTQVEQLDATQLPLAAEIGWHRKTSEIAKKEIHIYKNPLLLLDFLHIIFGLGLSDTRDTENNPYNPEIYWYDDLPFTSQQVRDQTNPGFCGVGARPPPCEITGDGVAFPGEDLSEWRKTYLNKEINLNLINVSDMRREYLDYDIDKRKHLGLGKQISTHLKKLIETLKDEVSEEEGGRPN